MKTKTAHLYWFVAGLLISFLIPTIFGNTTYLPVNWYYLIYFILIGTFLFTYAYTFRLPVRNLIVKNVPFAAVITLIFSFIMVKNVLSMPTTQALHDTNMLFDLGWRGMVYGFIDGLLLSSFPYLVVWNTFNVTKKPLIQKISYYLLAYIFVILITSAYHLGYEDFRSAKVLKANLGNVLISTPVITSGNPITGPIVHTVMHLTAVIHSPGTELFLPPHRI